ncbi:MULTISPECIES: type III secretion system outer membrane ring subunit SctC [unclassified Pseudomonas]|uniref:type III secretion system outer membrane ring subunit SctC n=1 Tax=unclassified Pseudomonas TaxID=196821 RepID=UPI000C88E908|nr:MULTISPECIES: type III secretion system outer membrane ring subunit SctC [unclassified Pseudomonas]PMZ90496.1 EscC/YscC/HrcC family type III secretion system outer membrane ring protein [Pseudomonas sp. FW305-42]PNA21246.1 EscC/YscC/HrcC family type III secretion system outer membrane ring protein [Pseudomonas sp. MPR-R1B]PNB26722.1 EscC/YscC/HrcC family type III secretion system outer membrane ring protein [Pseudomonas sp. DP16D-E2]PNB43896.1 EscC/YscC/HrcC family type III secretion system 
MAALRSLAAGLTALLASLAAQGESLDWPQEPFHYVAQGESLRDLLGNFAANYQGAVVVSDKVRDQVSATFEQPDPEAFLEQVAVLFNLAWYYDGAVLHVGKSSELQTRLVHLDKVREPQLRAALQEAGSWTSRFAWRAAAGGQLVYVSGPPRYLDRVEQTAKALEQQAVLQDERGGSLSVEVIALRHAVAEDREIDYRDQKVAVPGVATLLSRVLTNADIRAVEGQAVAQGAPVRSSQAVVQAEASLNAIIVRDHPERMPMYRRLVAALDRPAARIEVGLTILDINAEHLAELGVEWQVGIGTGKHQLIDIRTSAGQAQGTLAGSLVDSRGVDRLLAKVTLMQGEGRAQVVSRPTLLTQENTLAVIDHSETYYVRVLGERVAELKAITYGTLLKMTPRLIRSADRPEISLSLHIEDGSQKPNSTGPDGIPTISRTVIDTLARVDLGQSLMIGGIHRDESSESLRKVPLLGDIPFLGALFRYQSSSTRRSVRLFLIEPKLIDSGLANVGNGLKSGPARDERS